MRRPQAILSVALVAIAAIALIPSFGQWLFPRSPDQKVSPSAAGGRTWESRSTSTGPRDDATPTTVESLRSRPERDEERAQRAGEQLARTTTEAKELRDRLAEQVPQSTPASVTQPTMEVAKDRTAPEPTSEQAQEPTPQSNGGLSVTLLGCVATGALVTCEMRITNTRSDRHIKLWAESGSRLVDQDGNESRAAAASLGSSGKTFWWAENDLAEKTPTRAALYFEHVPVSSRKVALLQVTFGEGDASFGIKFHDVGIRRD